jgi:hypothetical protein
VDQFKLLKKPMDHLGKQINVPGSFWQGRMLPEERDKVYKCTIVDRELRNNKSTFTTKESDYLCSAVTTARKVLRDKLNARVFHGSSDLRPSNARLIQAYMSKQMSSKDYLQSSWNEHARTLYLKAL